MNLRRVRALGRFPVARDDNEFEGQRNDLPQGFRCLFRATVSQPLVNGEAAACSYRVPPSRAGLSPARS